jgi:hypothetical protein
MMSRAHYHRLQEKAFRRQSAELIGKLPENSWLWSERAARRICENSWQFVAEFS